MDTVEPGLEAEKLPWYRGRDGASGAKPPSVECRGAIAGDRFEGHEGRINGGGWRRLDGRQIRRPHHADHRPEEVAAGVAHREDRSCAVDAGIDEMAGIVRENIFWQVDEQPAGSRFHHEHPRAAVAPGALHDAINRNPPPRRGAAEEIAEIDGFRLREVAAGEHLDRVGGDHGHEATRVEPPADGDRGAEGVG